MSEQVYKDMVGVMAQRGLSFGGMDIPEFYCVVEELFTPEEAVINNAMPRGSFTAADIAGILSREEKDMEAMLKNMADKGLCFSHVKGGVRKFRAAPFVPGIFEFVFYRGTKDERDKKLARYIHDYKEAWQARQPIVIPYPIQRVITVDRTVETGKMVHTYDQVKTYIEQSDAIAVGRCYCRHMAELLGEDTHGAPMDVCMFLGRNAEFAIDCLGARSVTKDEGLKILEECEEAGLIHQTQNVTDEIGYICNCDRWHCFAVKIVLQQPHPGKMLNSGFEPRFDADLCTACETCIDRCPPEALVMGDDDLPKIDLNRCFGCAVCATGCPSDAVTMVNKPEFEAPPKNQKALTEALMNSLANPT